MWLTLYAESTKTEAGVSFGGLRQQQAAVEQQRNIRRVADRYSHTVLGEAKVIRLVRVRTACKCKSR